MLAHEQRPHDAVDTHVQKPQESMPEPELISLLLPPKQGVEKLIQTGVRKANAPWEHTLFLAINAGIFLGLGGGLAIAVGGGVPEIKEHNPGLQKLLFGAMFPIAIILVSVTGAELFTGNSCTVFMAVLARRVSFSRMLLNWTIVYFGNLAGTLLVAYFMFHLSGLNVNREPWMGFIRAYGNLKVEEIGWGAAVLRGIGCNYLVTLALYISAMSNDMASKFLGIWFPILVFVGTGFEHCIANMFYLSMAMLGDAPFGVGEAITQNLIPVTIGNIIGGSFFVGWIFWYVYAAEQRFRPWATTASIEPSAA
eukprot:TRINITY_DN1910_c0_g2_i2.p1 TRINITY_DN1910_c0_g2~~TRINITY_DN1910_c0_g2_i2.p1  ORF type:complete len:309 (-),score=67.22 TRINITY_DN1910_c0_g2_i2:11-937(-)